MLTMKGVIVEHVIQLTWEFELLFKRNAIKFVNQEGKIRKTFNRFSCYVTLDVVKCSQQNFIQVFRDFR
jgi:hypothetical protein